MFHKLIKTCIYMYKTKEEKYNRALFKSIGKKSNIMYPFMISHHEMISIGNNTIILPELRMQVFPENSGLKSEITIGNNCLFGQRCCILAGGNITIGDDVLVANGVSIISENHGMDPCDKNGYGNQPLLSKDIVIENGVWLGDGVKIMPGVKIGEKCIIGAGAIVTKNIPQYSIAVGIPAKVVKKYDFEKMVWEKI